MVRHVEAGHKQPLMLAAGFHREPWKFARLGLKVLRPGFEGLGFEGLELRVRGLGFRI